MPATNFWLLVIEMSNNELLIDNTTLERNLDTPCGDSKDFDDVRELDSEDLLLVDGIDHADLHSDGLSSFERNAASLRVDFDGGAQEDARRSMSMANGVVSAICDG